MGDGILVHHTAGVISRFSAGPTSDPKYEILYFSDDGKVSQDQTKAFYGVLTRPRTSTSARTNPMTTIPVQVDVRDIADLTNPTDADLIPKGVYTNVSD